MEKCLAKLCVCDQTEVKNCSNWNWSKPNTKEAEKLREEIIHFWSRKSPKILVHFLEHHQKEKG